MNTQQDKQKQSGSCFDWKSDEPIIFCTKITIILCKLSIHSNQGWFHKKAAQELLLLQNCLPP